MLEFQTYQNRRKKSQSQNRRITTHMQLQLRSFSGVQQSDSYKLETVVQWKDLAQWTELKEMLIQHKLSIQSDRTECEPTNKTQIRLNTTQLKA